MTKQLNANNSFRTQIEMADKTNLQFNEVSSPEIKPVKKLKSNQHPLDTRTLK